MVCYGGAAPSVAADLAGEDNIVGMFRGRRRQRSGADSTGVRYADAQDREHLEQFLTTRRGVEAFVEPRTTVTETTVVLVASDGEWTRRRIDGPKGAWDFASRHAIPVYDVAIVGYPKRMREWNARQKASGGA
jgi:hypothetical protein